MTNSTTMAGDCPGGPRCMHKVTLLWNDRCRHTQVKRFEALQVQTCDAAGQSVWDLIQEQLRSVPPEVRIDVPSPRVFSRVLGVYRTAVMLKKDPMRVLELSAEEIARLAGYSKSQVEAALRWLGDQPITYLGKQIALGLGFIKRTTRKGKLMICNTVRGVFRTSLTQLSAIGRSLIGLLKPESTATKGPPRETPWQRAKRERKARVAAGTGGQAAKGNAPVAKNQTASTANSGAEAPSEPAPDDPSTWSPARREYEEIARRVVAKRRAAPSGG
jgi:hypothetical protein